MEHPNGRLGLGCRRLPPESAPVSRGRFPPPQAGTLVPNLLNWFRGHARDLPWRRTLDPYGIWVSEIMLQQTQVRTVIPYWERWMAALPDVTALARAPEERVLKLWEGLGYYSRARNLQRAARVLVEESGGRIPQNVPALLELPGIGRYTAGAIASIAFNQPAPILDGNVIRVLTRLYALGGDPKSAPVNQRLWSLAGELVTVAATHGSAGHRPASAGPCSALNQSLMELGATLCTPRDPQCKRCPVSANCLARLMDRTDSYPEPSLRAPTTVQRKVVVIIERSGRYLVRQRAQEGINGGFWEFPERDLIAGESPAEVAASWLGSPISSLLELNPVRHSITRYRIQLAVFYLRTPGGRNRKELGTHWATAEELAELALTAAHRRIARQIPG